MNLRYIPLILTGFLIYSASAFLPTAALATITIPLSVTLSEAVTVTGTPRIAVDVGGTTRYATYTSGSGTAALTFTLSPQAGDVDLDGITVSSPIQLNGGTIKDTAGNDAALTFTPPNTSGIKINYPSLSMDFVYDSDGRYTLNGTAYNDLTSFLTATGGSFTRSSVATYFDSTGTLQTAAVNQPRFDYDPVSHQARGILIEESRTNSTKHSDQFDHADYIKNASNVIANVATAPDGTLSADKLTINATTSGHSIQEAIGNSVTAGITYTGSFFLKSAGYQYVDLYFGYSNFPSSNGATFDLTTGTVTHTFASTSADIKNVGNGWYRCSITVTASTTGSANSALFAWVSNNTGIVTPSTIMGDGTSGYYLWGAQVEVGSFPSSYIPTTTSTVTRGTETLNVTAGSWYNASASTFYANAYSETNSNQDYRGRWIAYNSAVILGNGGTASSIETWSGSSPQTQISYSPASSQTQAAKAAFAWDTTANTRSLIANGGTIQTTSIPGSYNISSIYIGCCGSAPGQLNAPIREVKYYPLRLTSTQIQQLTQ